MRYSVVLASDNRVSELSAMQTNSGRVKGPMVRSGELTTRQKVNTDKLRAKGVQRKGEIGYLGTRDECDEAERFRHNDESTEDKT